MIKINYSKKKFTKKKAKALKINKFFKTLSIFLFISCLTILVSGAVVSVNFPDYYKVTQTDKQETATVYSAVKTRLISCGNTLEQDALSSFEDNNNYKMELRLLDIIPIKTVNAQMVEETSIIPCGDPFGVKIFTKGAIVVGISDINIGEICVNPAKEAGLKKGDIILKANDIEITNNEELLKITESCDGKNLKLDCVRGDSQFSTQIQPIKSQADGLYKLGVWVRDSSVGIGTMTFYNPCDHTFAGLGHGICDIDTGELLPVSHGDIVKASINGINRAVRGIPGELKGFFIDGEAIGSLYKNTIAGVYGNLYDPTIEKEKCIVAMKHQIKKGKAQIITTVSGMTPSLYDIEIKGINYNKSQPSKNMIIEITDPILLDKTGGIIQGMSGSPIIQEGKLIGAVTHVFVNEPTKGYGIFAETMLEESSK